MKVWILRRLRAEARVWSALDDQRRSIRRTLDVIRKTIANTGTYVLAGIGGTTIHYARGCTLSSYSGLEGFAVAQLLVEIGTPLIDTRSIVNKHRIIGLPLVAIGHDPDPEPWHSMSYAPLCVYAAQAAALGARTRNIVVADLAAPQGWMVAHA